MGATDGRPGVLVPPTLPGPDEELSVPRPTPLPVEFVFGPFAAEAAELLLGREGLGPVDAGF